MIFVYVHVHLLSLEGSICQASPLQSFFHPLSILCSLKASHCAQHILKEYEFWLTSFRVSDLSYLTFFFVADLSILYHSFILLIGIYMDS
jgi:hypothetical protein